MPVSFPRARVVTLAIMQREQLQNEMLRQELLRNQMLRREQMRNKMQRRQQAQNPMQHGQGQTLNPLQRNKARRKGSERPSCHPGMRSRLQQSMMGFGLGQIGSQRWLGPAANEGDNGQANQGAGSNENGNLDPDDPSVVAKRHTINFKWSRDFRLMKKHRPPPHCCCPVCDPEYHRKYCVFRANPDGDERCFMCQQEQDPHKKEGCHCPRCMNWHGCQEKKEFFPPINYGPPHVSFLDPIMHPPSPPPGVLPIPIKPSKRSQTRRSKTHSSSGKNSSGSSTSRSSTRRASTRRASTRRASTRRVPTRAQTPAVFGSNQSRSAMALKKVEDWLSRSSSEESSRSSSRKSEERSSDQARPRPVRRNSILKQAALSISPVLEEEEEEEAKPKKPAESESTSIGGEGIFTTQQSPVRVSTRWSESRATRRRRLSKSEFFTFSDSEQSASEVEDGSIDVKDSDEEDSADEDPVERQKRWTNECIDQLPPYLLKLLYARLGSTWREDFTWLYYNRQHTCMSWSIEMMARELVKAPHRVGDRLPTRRFLRQVRPLTPTPSDLLDKDETLGKSEERYTERLGDTVLPTLTSQPQRSLVAPLRPSCGWCKSAKEKLAPLVSMVSAPPENKMANPHIARRSDEEEMAIRLAAISLRNHMKVEEFNELEHQVEAEKLAKEQAEALKRKRQRFRKRKSKSQSSMSSTSSRSTDSDLGSFEK